MELHQLMEYGEVTTDKAPIVAEQQGGGWLYEDELPDDYPYDAMFPYSKVDGVRLFPALPRRSQT